MKQTTFIVLLASFFGLTINLNAQVNKQSAEEQEKQVLREKFQQGMQARKMQQIQGATFSVQTDRYNHREAEIMGKLNTESIPSDFPIYQNQYSDEQYTILINKWYVANPALVKKESTNEQK